MSNVFLNLILITNYGAYGAIISTLVSESIVVLYLIFSIKKFFNVTTMLFSKFYKYAIGSFIMFAVTRVFEDVLPTTFFAVILEIIVGITTYLNNTTLAKSRYLEKLEKFFY
ncbi:polysaccharide biosynthesis C-terminal domain-containing protein [Leuconostoc falkenbergense]|uniref:polysaccharide biosynthesis C-terminal domain-containing protein n=1 Tax=Leuconostoc falkenbergense TaxID=2766470 RepID=UPI003D15A149